MKNLYNYKKPIFKNKKFLENFFNKKGLKLLVELSKKKRPTVNQRVLKQPYVPELIDLYNLYNYVILNKRITILEFGSGWSTLILSLALKELRDRPGIIHEVKSLRRNNPFEIFVIENERKFLNITRKRINKFNKFLGIKNPIKINYCFSDVEMTTFNDRICTQYKKLPLCNPDFIYLDGPGQFNVKKDINGISLKHKDMLPMACDILKFVLLNIPNIPHTILYKNIKLIYFIHSTIYHIYLSYY